MTDKPANVRDLLRRDPLSFDELLDLFEAYLSTLAGPLMSAVELIREEFDYRQGDIFQKIVTPVDDASDMAKRLRQIRAARGAGTDVTVILPEDMASLTEVAASTAVYLLSGAGSIFDMLHSGLTHGHLDPQDRGTLAMLEMVGRGFNASADDEGATLGKLGELVRAQRRTQTRGDVG